MWSLRQLFTSVFVCVLQIGITRPGAVSILTALAGETLVCDV